MRRVLPLLLGLFVLTRTRKAETPKRKTRKRGRCTCTRFLALFRRFGQRFNIPPTYLQALACRESSCDPTDQDGPAWGLMQITEVVRKSLPRDGQGPNSRYDREELLNPEVSLYLCCRTLANVVRVYTDVGLTPNWTDPVWIGLVTAGWNAGYSKRAGVGKVIRYLKKRRIKPTIDTVHANARQAGAVRFLWKYPHRLKWWRSVVRHYFALLQAKQAKTPNV